MGHKACLFPWPLSPGKARGRKKCAALYLWLPCLSCSQAEGSDFFFTLSLSHFSVNWLLTAGGYYWLQKLHFLAPELLIFSWIIAVSGGQIQVPESLGCFGFDLESFFCSPHHMKQSFDHCRHMLKKKNPAGRDYLIISVVSGNKLEPKHFQPGLKNTSAWGHPCSLWCWGLWHTPKTCFSSAIEQQLCSGPNFSCAQIQGLQDAVV